MQTILIIDDTKININIIMEILEESYDILVALDGQTALNLLETEPIDLILLDIVMPKMNGYDVCKRIRKNKRIQDIPVIFITAKTDEESIENAYEVGGNDYVNKPFKPKELQARVKNQLKLKELRKKELEYNKQIALSELIHNIAHQWRQPLSKISTLSSGICLQKKYDIISDEEVVNMCENITTTTKNLSRTIESFKKFTQENSRLESINLNNLFKKNDHLLFPNIVDKKIQIVLDIDDSITLVSYSNQLLQVFISLISNCEKALDRNTIEEKIIIIRAFYQNDEVTIEVTDNALGICDTIIGKIFEPYTTNEHQSQNKGLGLYLVHSIVTQLLKGEIHAKNILFYHNNKKYKGASFTLTLPNL